MNLPTLSRRSGFSDDLPSEALIAFVLECAGMIGWGGKGVGRITCMELECERGGN